MTPRELARWRLTQQRIATSHAASGSEVVATLLAMQAQDYAGGLWAIGLRWPHATLADVERAIADGSVVRTWPMRGTLHFVAAADVRWLLDLLAPSIIAAAAGRHRDLGLDAATFRKVEKVLLRALAGGAQLTRNELRVELERAKISTDNGRLYHCLVRMSLEKLVCCGAPRGKQQTFTLLSEWVPEAKPLARDAALAQLAQRYFAGHGPATQADLMRWAGIGVKDANAAIADARAHLHSLKIGAVEHWLGRDAQTPSAAASGMFLLPGFDEFILGYKDRSAMLAPEHAPKIAPGGNGLFKPSVVHDARVIGTWKASATRRQVHTTADGFKSLTKTQQRLFGRATEAYASFLESAADTT